MKFGRPKQNGHRLWLSVSKVCVREISLTGQTNGQREINRRLLHALHYRQNAIHAIPRGKLCTCAWQNSSRPGRLCNNQVLVVCMVILYYCVTNVLFFIICRLLQSYNLLFRRPNSRPSGPISLMVTYNNYYLLLYKHIRIYSM